MSEHQESFWTKYVFSQDHKWIGIQYGVTALFFMLFGFMLMLVMRYNMVHNATITGDTYNSFGAMHGTIMVFLGVVPVIVGAYGNYLVPLQIGAPDMAFPKLNMASYWSYFLGGVLMLLGFVIPLVQPFLFLLNSLILYIPFKIPSSQFFSFGISG